MSETSESGIDSAPDVAGASRLRRALTWVGIVAGAVFIVGAIFVAGAATGWLPAWHEHHGTQAVSMPQKGDSPMKPADGDKCCCDKMEKK
jgi:predicted phage tail protein